MMRRLLSTGLIAGLLAVTSPAQAADPAGVTNLVAPSAALDPGKAYLLFDSSDAKSGMFRIGHVFMRVPSETEVDAFLAAKREAYDKDLPKLRKKAKDGPVPTFEEYGFTWKGAQNTFAVDLGKPLGAGITYLLEVPAGTYVLYGVSVGTRGFVSCNCLGTVKFEARPGQITQLGALYAAKVHKDSPVPYLEDNLGEQMFQYGFIMGQALVPATEATPVPAALAGLPLVRASFAPVGMFAEPSAPMINRLAPIPGILEYDRGRVILPEE
jgi:hypothetical protein